MNETLRNGNEERDTNKGLDTKEKTQKEHDITSEKKEKTINIVRGKIKEKTNQSELNSKAKGMGINKKWERG